MNQKSSPGLVTFERKDIKPPYIEQAAREFAVHFQTKRVYIKDIFRLIIDSKYWSKQTLKINIENWKKMFPKYEPALVSEIIELVVKWFTRCKDNCDITDLRGSLVESLVMAYVRKNYKLNMYGSNFGWGAKVTIHPSSGKRTVQYICTANPKHHNECGDRHTVDIGIWDGQNGKFYECKVNPSRIGCSEVKYMDELSRNLSHYGISHEIFFVFANTSDNVTMRIADYGSDFEFQLIGTEELSKMLSA